MKPTDAQLKDWWRISFRRAASYCRYGHSIPESIARGMAKIAYKEGYKAALAAASQPK